MSSPRSPVSLPLASVVTLGILMAWGLVGLVLCFRCLPPFWAAPYSLLLFAAVAVTYCEDVEDAHWQARMTRFGPVFND